MNQDREEEPQRLFLKLMGEREIARPVRTKSGETDEALEKSMRAINAGLRSAITKLKSQEESTRSRLELPLLDKLQKLVQKTLTSQEKACKELEKEIEFFLATFNARITYYRQLQSVSDMLDALDAEKECRAAHAKDNEELLTKMAVNEKILREKVASARSKGRYLEHLKLTSGQAQKVCIICQDEFGKFFVLLNARLVDFTYIYCQKSEFLVFADINFVSISRSYI